MRILLSASLLAALSCTACASSPSDPQGGNTPPAESPAAECQADPAQKHVGQKAETQVVEAAKASSNARQLRVVGPNDAVTMDFRPDRLNILVDDKRTITSISCG